MENQSPRLNKNERILVLQTAFLGDIVLATSFLKAVRSIYPRASIAILTTPAGVEVLNSNPWSIELIPYNKRANEAGFRGFLQKSKILRQWKPSLVFCLHRSLRSTLL